MLSLIGIKSIDRNRQDIFLDASTKNRANNFTDDDFIMMIFDSVEQCTSACFLSVQPGVTSVEAAVMILTSHGGFTSPSLLPSPVIKGIGYLETNVITDNHKYYLFGRYKLSDQIILFLSTDSPPILLGEIVSELGAPQYVFPKINIFHLDQPGTWGVDVIWLEKGIAFSTGGTITDLPPRIDQNLVFTQITLFQPSIKGYREAINPNITTNDFTLWDGYKDFYAYYTP